MKSTKAAIVGTGEAISLIEKAIIEKGLNAECEIALKPTEQAKEWFSFKSIVGTYEYPYVSKHSNTGYRSTLTNKQKAIRKAKSKQQRNSRRFNR